MKIGKLRKYLEDLKVPLLEEPSDIEPEVWHATKKTLVSHKS